MKCNSWMLRAKSSNLLWYLRIRPIPSRMTRALKSYWDTVSYEIFLDMLLTIMPSVFWNDCDGKENSRTEAIIPFAAETLLLNPMNNIVWTGKEGAVFILLKPSSKSGKPPYSDMKQLATYNIFPERFPANVKNMQFPWVRVADRPWANGRFKVRLAIYDTMSYDALKGCRILQPRRIPCPHC
jgi:hypothetical protein